MVLDGVRAVHDEQSLSNPLSSGWEAGLAQSVKGKVVVVVVVPAVLVVVRAAVVVVDVIVVVVVVVLSSKYEYSLSSPGLSPPSSPGWSPGPSGPSLLPSLFW
jgi:hypothetical protein